MATNSECGRKTEPRRIIFQSLLIVLSLIVVVASGSAQTNESLAYYFNIDKPFNWLGNSLKQ